MKSLTNLIILILIIGAGWYGYTHYWKQAVALKPKDADFPAAGACDFQPGDMVTVSLQEGIPNPRCAKIRPVQKLKIVNDTDKKVRIWFENISPSILPAGSVYLDPESDYIFGRGAGEYLEPGVHRLKTSLYSGSGPEIWLTNE